MRRNFVTLITIILLISTSAAAQQTDKIDEYILSEMQKEKVPGLALAIIKDGKVVKAKGYGFANVEHQVPVKPETVFQSGSMGKQFTATAVMMLVEEGKVSLDDKITKYFPEGPEAVVVDFDAAWVAAWGPEAANGGLVRCWDLPSWTGGWSRRLDPNGRAAISWDSIAIYGAPGSGKSALFDLRTGRSITSIPSDRRISAPAPAANTRGTTPRMNANEVIRIGRSRSRAASTAAVQRSRP